MNWVSVKDRMPDEKEWVLVCLQGRERSNKSHRPLDLCYYLAYCQKYTNDGPLMWTCGGTVTHWMPLPRLPE